MNPLFQVGELVSVRENHGLGKLKSNTKVRILCIYTDDADDEGYKYYVNYPGMDEIGPFLERRFKKVIPDSIWMTE
jgi:hypothetical protein